MHPDLWESQTCCSIALPWLKWGHGGQLGPSWTPAARSTEGVETSGGSAGCEEKRALSSELPCHCEPFIIFSGPASADSEKVNAQFPRTPTLVVNRGVGGLEPKLQAIPVQVQVLQIHHHHPLKPTTSGPAKWQHLILA